jgi:hypothetical protein
MSGAITLLPLYGFMAWTGTILPLHLLNKEILDSQDLYHIRVTDNE